MVVLDIRHDPEIRMDKRVGAVGLVDLHDEEIVPGACRGGVAAVYRRSDEESRFPPGMGEDVGEHCRDGGFSVRPGNRDRPPVECCEACEKFAAPDLRDSAFRGPFPFRILCCHGGGVDDQFRVFRQELRAVSGVDRRAERCQMGGFSV